MSCAPIFNFLSGEVWKMVEFPIFGICTHVAGAAVIPLQNWTEKRLVFFESLSYASSEIGLERIFHLRPQKISQFSKFLEKSKGGTLLYQKIFFSPILLIFKIWSPYDKRMLYIRYRFHILNFSKIGEKNFFDIEGSPLWIFQEI